MTQKVLSFDLGGTKLEAGVLTKQGKILDCITVPALMEQGKEAVIDQIITLGRDYIQRHPEIERIGMVSAGPLDPQHGLLLDPTNYAGPKGTWGVVPLAKVIQRRLKKPTVLENDAAAAMLAEHWIGAAKKTKNAMVLTLGTGLGTGILCNGSLLRAGRHRHTEAGHIIIHHNDKSAPCGCGNLGCAEAYLSGRNFGRRAQQSFGRSDLSAKDIANLAKRHDPRAISAFEEYSEIMATALYSYTKLYSPEVYIFAGSFSQAAPLFLPHTQRHFERMMERDIKTEPLPKLVISQLKNHSGLIGGAYIAFHPKKKEAP